MEISNGFLVEQLKRHAQDVDSAYHSESIKWLASFRAIEMKFFESVHPQVDVGLAMSEVRLADRGVPNLFTIHGCRHIVDLVKSLDKLAESLSGADTPGEALRPEEAYILLCAAHVHDAANVIERSAHPERCQEILSHYVDLFTGTPVIEAVYHVARVHGGTHVVFGRDTFGDLPTDNRSFPRLPLLAALLRLGDELSENESRVPQLAEKYHEHTPESALAFSYARSFRTFELRRGDLFLTYNVYPVSWMVSEAIEGESALFQDDSQKSLISESHFSILIVLQLLRVVRGNQGLVPTGRTVEFMDLVRRLYSNAFKFSSLEPSDLGAESLDEFLNRMIWALEEQQQYVIQYVGTRLFEDEKFSGPLFLFDGLLGSIADWMEGAMEKRVYVLIDDADDLPESHTIVLNTWIARRRSSLVFKVSTMFGYKTYQTRARSAIQHPHDFFHIDMATRFLIVDALEDYVDLLRRIVEKRLKIKDVKTVPGKHPAEEFFPEEPVQRENLERLAHDLEKKYQKKFEGRAVRDNVYRHLSSEYLKILAAKRSSDSFVYSGFQTIAILSSGMLRDFIICAQRMFDQASRDNSPVNQIPPQIQSSVVRTYADEVLEEIVHYKQKRQREASRDDWKDIRNLIEGLGSLYKAKMLSDDSERRVFSFALQDEAPPDLEKLLDLAIAEGYLMKGFISRKEGTGRRALYVLTRRVAPAFNLDVSAYSGYLSVRSEVIYNLIRTRGSKLAPDEEQLKLFDTVALISTEDGPADAEWRTITQEEVSS